MNRIELKLNQSISGLAGNEYGYEIYLNQVKERFDWDGINVIVFPNYVERVAISFIQGFCREILNKISKSEIDKYIKIESSSEYLTNKILENIKF